MGGVAVAAMARRSWMVLRTKRRLKRHAKAPSRARSDICSVHNFLSDVIHVYE